MPVGVVMSVVIARVVPAYTPGETRARLDVPGAVLVTAGLMTAVFYLSQSPDWGWLDARTLPALAGALVLLALFVVNEQRARHPLIPRPYSRTGTSPGPTWRWPRSTRATWACSS